MKVPGGAIARLLLLILHTLMGALIAAFAPKDSLTTRALGRRIVCWWHRTLLVILGVRLRVIGHAPTAPVLIVANHISWLDIAALGSIVSGHFVAKAEIRSWPLIGWLAARAGTLYIRRGDRRASVAVAEGMTAALRAQQSVLLFPEGTSTDGHTVHAFHPRLFVTAIQAQRPVLPVALRYPVSGGAVHPAAPFIGDDTLVAHLWRLLRARGTVAVETIFLAAVDTAARSPHDLAAETQAAIAACVTQDHPVNTDSRRRREL
ncbi:MAG: lysophospholipid acyltransferase family protein [Acidiferrobacter sp.]